MCYSQLLRELERLRPAVPAYTTGKMVLLHPFCIYNFAGGAMNLIIFLKPCCFFVSSPVSPLPLHTQTCVHKSALKYFQYLKYLVKYLSVNSMNSKFNLYFDIKNKF